MSKRTQHMSPNFLMKISMTLLVLLMILGSISLFAQQNNAFYINILNQSERLYLAQDYVRAIDKLNIAAFGIYGDDELKAKALVYMSLSYFFLKDKANSEKHLNKAKELVGENGILTLDIDQAAVFDLERLLYTLKAGGNPQDGLKVLPKLPEENLAEEQLSSPPQLEQRIKENPTDPTLYYTLYNLFRDNFNFNEAKNTIKDLVKNNPNEIYGYYLLGIIQYQERKFKDARTSFENFFELSQSQTVKNEIVLEAKAYQILCDYLRGERDKAQKTYAESAALFTLESIRILPLSNKDKGILLNLIKEYSK